MSTNRTRAKRAKLKKTSRTRSRPKHTHGVDPIRGLTFDLCCGQMGIASGIGDNRGEYKVEMEAHGFNLTVLLSEQQALDLGKGLVECVTEAKKGVN